MVLIQLYRRVFMGRRGDIVALRQIDREGGW